MSFDVNADGTLSNIKAENDPGYGIKEEAKRILAKSPKWTPAVVNGKKVMSSQLLPVSVFVGNWLTNTVHNDKKEYYYFGWSRPMRAEPGDKQIILFTGIKKGKFTSDELRQKANKWGGYATKKWDPGNNICTSDLNTYPNYLVAQKAMESIKSRYADPDNYVIRSVSF